MTETFIEQWELRKPPTRAAGGVVAAQSVRAAEVGAAVLSDGGNAVDAAVATAMALAVAEPWMSGLGGCGYMMVYRAADRTVHVVDFGCLSPAGLDPAAYPLAEGAVDDDLFGWPEVAEGRNVHGPLSIAVPGSVDGLALALSAFGTKPWAEMLTPAVELAKKGHRVDWWTTLKVASEAGLLRQHEAGSAVWLPDGLPPVAADPADRFIDMGHLAATLARLAEAGPRDFYEGDLARALLADLGAVGSVLSAADLAGYRARVTTAQKLQRGATELHVLRGLTAGPTFADALSRLPALPQGAPGAESYAAIAAALAGAYDHRLAKLGHDGDTAGQGSTTHLSVMDRDGNMVALTNTLLSLFGSKVLSPRTGVMMNNGVMWFDPRPGRANSIAAGKPPLCNITPVMATRDGAPFFAVGGSGGRRILAACFQLSAFLTDCGLDFDSAVHQPRINVDGGAAVEIDARLPADVFQAVEARGLATRRAEALVTPHAFANPQIVLRDGSDSLGATQVRLPGAAAVGA